jgi:hypothetical protein
MGNNDDTVTLGSYRLGGHRRMPRKLILEECFFIALTLTDLIRMDALGVRWRIVGLDQTACPERGVQ